MSSTNPEPSLGKTLPEAATCANCGAVLQGAYCAACGQRDEPLSQPIGLFLKEAFIEFFGVDGRLWRSLGLLLFQPGRLTTAYLTGRRVRYIRPLRIYLTASLLFFFLLTLIDPVGKTDLGGEEVQADTTVRVADYRSTLDTRLTDNAKRLATKQALVDSLKTQFTTDSLALPTDSLISDADSLIQLRTKALDDVRGKRDDARRDLGRLQEQLQSENRQWMWIDKQLAEAPPDSLIHPADLKQAAELLFEDAPGNRVNINLPGWWPQSEAVRQMRTARTNKQLKSGIASFLRDMLRHLPTVMFLLLPIFALLLKLLYLRRGRYYTEHLIFGLHTHGFAFTLFAMMLLLTWTSGGATWANMAAGLLVLTIPLYFYLAQQHVYRQSWLKTALKACLLGGMYFLVLNAGIAMTMIFAAAF